jgi:hypothetical protein
MLLASERPSRIPIQVHSGDVLPTGNEWIALPEIRAADAALMNFNVLSMRDRGLLEAVGNQGAPVILPYFSADDEQIEFRDPTWELIEYWIPTAHLTNNGMDTTITYCAPPGSRGAFIHMTITNRRTKSASVVLGVKVSWGSLYRATYRPVDLRGERVVAPAPWVDDAEAFGFVTHDTKFAWTLQHEGAEGKMSAPPSASALGVDAHKSATLSPGQTVETNFVLGVGVEEFSASYSAEAISQLIYRAGADGVIAQAAAWSHRHTRTTGRPALDKAMNRNFLFAALYAWGRTLDTEQMVGVTSRSPRYYVSAAYWDRDAMLWSFSALLDIDKSLAREALDYALTVQLRNTGVHSRFIDGVALEEGFQLDEAVAPIVAIADYVKQTGDFGFLTSHRDAPIALRERFLSRYDANTGLYSTLQDSQDEYQKLPLSTYSNVLTWRSMLDLADLFGRLNDDAGAQEMTQRAEALRNAILQYSVSSGAPGASGPIFACSTDGKNAVFADVPPGSLMKLPALGFVSERDPVFLRTSEWLHSKDYKYSHAQMPYGLPGSYRLPFTTSWGVADYLRLAAGREQALKILLKSNWDGGIIAEGISPESAVADSEGRGFATAAGYVAHAICETYCTDRQK